MGFAEGPRLGYASSTKTSRSITRVRAPSCVIHGVPAAVPRWRAMPTSFQRRRGRGVPSLFGEAFGALSRGHVWVDVHVVHSPKMLHMFLIVRSL